MTNPGLPPTLSRLSRGEAEARAKALRESLDELLADVDEALGRPPLYDGAPASVEDAVPASRQNFNRQPTAA